MDFMDRLNALASKSRNLGATLQTEEAAKNALVMPFLHLLGYDVFNPAEVVPEYSAPLGEVKDARVDYAIISGGKPIMLVECKPYGTALETKQCNQLLLYFHATEARVAILTDGNRYRFYSDLEVPNKMDSKHYMEFVLEELDEALIPEIRKLGKDKFDVESALSSANELKYTREFKRILAEQMVEPHDEMVRFFVSQVYDGKITQGVKDRFAPILKSSLEQFVNDRINERLKNAMTRNEKPEQEQGSSPAEPLPDESEVKIITTEEEWQAYYLVKSLLVGTISTDRVTIKDAQSYCAILLDGKNNRPICRLHFNRKQKQIGLFDGEKKDDRVPIEGLDDLLPLAERLRATVLAYDGGKEEK